MKRSRKKSVKHRILESYYYRSNLSQEDLGQLDNERKGHQGELCYDVEMQVLPSEYLLVNDLMLPYGKTHFQIDGLVAVGDTLLHYEVKNYTGTYKKDGDYCISTTTGHRIVEPHSQITKSNTMLYNTMRKLGYNFRIISYTVFINPEFYMANVENDSSILFAHQFPRHVRALQKKPCKPNKQMKEFLGKLIEMNDEDYRPPNLPTGYVARPGIMCDNCHSFQSKGTRETWVCADCGFQEPVVHAIARTAEEFHLLDPSQTICTKNVFDWCGGKFGKQQIRSALKRHFVQHQNGRGTVYTKRRRAKS